MADNYLEKKMEELRKGPEKTYTGRKAVQRKGFVQFAFPPKRVVIASEIACRNSIARAFLKADCKVAMIHPFQEEGERMAHDEGVRYYPFAINESFENLLSAWRDVDIIVADPAEAMTLLPIWKKHRERFPYVSSYICRVIVIGDADVKELQELAKGIKTTVNIIASHSSYTDISELILALSLPATSDIDGLKLP